MTCAAGSGEIRCQDVRTLVMAMKQASVAQLPLGWILEESPMHLPATTSMSLSSSSSPDYDFDV